MRRLAILATLCAALSAHAAGRLTENVVTAADKQQTYTLFLPGSYDAAKKHPLLLIFDPRGRGTAAAEIFSGAAEEYGWILISSNGTRSDESSDPNERSLRALFPELSRYASIRGASMRRDFPEPQSWRGRSASTPAGSPA